MSYGRTKTEYMDHTIHGWMVRTPRQKCFQQVQHSFLLRNQDETWEEVSDKDIPVKMLRINRRENSRYVCEDCGKVVVESEFEEGQCRDCFVGVKPIEEEVSNLRAENVIPIGGVQSRDYDQTMIVGKH